MIIPCKNCKWWEPWKLPQGKTLFDMAKKTGMKGDCRNPHPYNQNTATFSSTTCDYAEAKDEEKD